MSDSSFSPGKSYSSIFPLAVRKCFLPYICALSFCLCPPTFNNKVKNILIKKCSTLFFCHHQLPAFIISVPTPCLEQYDFNVLIKSKNKLKKKKAQLPSSRKTESERQQSTCVHEHLGRSSAYFFILDDINIIFPSSKQTALKWCLPCHHELLKSCHDWTIDKILFLSIRAMSEGIRILMCHNFGYQLKYTEAITCICVRDIGLM